MGSICYNKIGGRVKIAVEHLSSLNEVLCRHSFQIDIDAHRNNNNLFRTNLRFQRHREQERALPQSRVTLDSRIKSPSLHQLQ